MFVFSSLILLNECPKQAEVVTNWKYKISAVVTTSTGLPVTVWTPSHYKHWTASDCLNTFPLQHSSELQNIPFHNNNSHKTQLYWFTVTHCTWHTICCTFRPLQATFRPSLNTALLHLAVRYNQKAITTVTPYTSCSPKIFLRIHYCVQSPCNDSDTNWEGQCRAIIWRWLALCTVYRSACTVHRQT